MKRILKNNNIVIMAIFCMSLIPFTTLSSAFATPPETISNVSTKTATPYKPLAIHDLQIDGVGSNNINVNIYAVTGSFTLGNSANITYTGMHTGNNLQIAGLRTDVNNALNSLLYTPSAYGTVQIQVRLGGGDGDVYNPVNGHVYQVITPSSTISWQNAQTAAAASTYGGVNGYLATITSQSENDFVKARITASGWIGANDLATQYTWKWVTGPESGTALWQGRSAGLGGVALNGQYTNWYNDSSNLTTGSEPNNSGGNEHCMELNVNENFQWNDLNCSSDSSYIVEYGAPGALPVTTQSSFTVNATDDGDGGSTSVENAGPNNGDANNDGILDSQQSTVTSINNQVTGAYSVLEATGCVGGNTSVSIGLASNNSRNDANYTYPLGMFNYVTACATNGQTATITQYYYGNYTASDYTLRKYDMFQGYITIPGAVFNNVTIGGLPALKVTYAITDGGSLDQDLQANGVIIDPAGPALRIVATQPASNIGSLPGAPNTGLKVSTEHGSLIGVTIGLLIMTGAGMYTIRRQYDKAK